MVHPQSSLTQNNQKSFLNSNEHLTPTRKPQQRLWNFSELFLIPGKLKKRERLQLGRKLATQTIGMQMQKSMLAQVTERYHRATQSANAPVPVQGNHEQGAYVFSKASGHDPTQHESKALHTWNLPGQTRRVLWSLAQAMRRLDLASEWDPTRTQTAALRYARRRYSRKGLCERPIWRVRDGSVRPASIVAAALPQLHSLHCSRLSCVLLRQLMVPLKLFIYILFKNQDARNLKCRNPTRKNMTASTAIPKVPTKAYLVGGGIASLSAAVYLIRHAKMNPHDITIFENLPVTGGSMDATGNHKKGYLMRGGRMFDEEAYTCLFDLLSEIPSKHHPGKTCKEVIFEFSARVPTDAHARLIEEGCVKADAARLGVSVVDSARFGELLVLPEDAIQGRGIDEYFTEAFFESNFWFCMRSTFAFQPWHSLIEFKRYCLRFMHEVPKLFNLGGVWRSPFNQYDSIIAPVTAWLVEQGIVIQLDTEVTSLDFEVTERERSVYKIHLKQAGAAQEIPVSKTDLVFTTLGSLTAASSIGDDSHPAPAVLQQKAEQDPTWTLWGDIAKRQPDFGRPAVFSSNIAASQFLSFSVTLRGDAFMRRYIAWSGNQPGTGALVTFKHSKWGMSIVVPHQPHFANQPEDVSVFWGYGLFPDEVGNFVGKPMRECSGREIMQEVMHMLAFDEGMEEILDSSYTIPAMLPYTMAQFVKRSKGDRPEVVPAKAVNFAFLGQFVEHPDDVVFTVEYSVRCAQIAVYKLCSLDRAVTPMYKGWRDPTVVISAIKAMLH